MHTEFSLLNFAVGEHLGDWEVIKLSRGVKSTGPGLELCFYDEGNEI
jgi:hypothetical protein